MRKRRFLPAIATATAGLVSAQELRPVAAVRVAAATDLKFALGASPAGMG